MLWWSTIVPMTTAIHTITTIKVATRTGPTPEIPTNMHATLVVSMLHGQLSLLYVCLFSFFHLRCFFFGFVYFCFFRCLVQCLFFGIVFCFFFNWCKLSQTDKLNIMHVAFYDRHWWMMSLNPFFIFIQIEIHETVLQSVFIIILSFSNYLPFYGICQRKLISKNTCIVPCVCYHVEKRKSFWWTKPKLFIECQHYFVYICKLLKKYIFVFFTKFAPLIQSKLQPKPLYF